MGQYYIPQIYKATEEPECFRDNLLATFVSHDFGNGSKLMEHSYVGNGFVKAVLDYIRNVGEVRLVWAGDYADSEPGSTDNLYCLYGDVLNVKGPKKTKRNPRYILNWSKNEFVSVFKSPKDEYGWRIHPLPLLTCEGNGRGGGDYCSENGEDFIGRWARDIISVTSKKEDTIGFDEIEPGFLE